MKRNVFFDENKTSQKDISDDEEYAEADERKENNKCDGRSIQYSVFEKSNHRLAIKANSAKEEKEKWRKAQRNDSVASLHKLKISKWTKSMFRLCRLM